jgi:hypothetical protein
MEPGLDRVPVLRSRGLRGESASWKLPTEADWLALWEQLRDAFARFRAGEPWLLAPVRLKASVNERAGTVKVESGTTVEGFVENVLVRVGRLIAASRRLRVCLECKQFLVARRGQRRHPRCKQEARNRQRREARGGRP